MTKHNSADGVAVDRCSRAAGHHFENGECVYCLAADPAFGVAGTPALTDEQIVQLAIKAGLDEEMWFGPHTPPSAKDCLPELRKFAELVRALGVDLPDGAKHG